MKKSKVLSLILAFALILTAIYVPITTAFADATQDENGFVIDGTVLTGYNGTGGEITIPSTVTKIENGAFRNKTNITKITVPYTVTESGSSILEGSSVETIVFEDAPDGVTAEPLVLADLVFNCSYSLKHVDLPKRLADIPSTAFQSCRVLETVTVNNDNSTVNANAFNGIREGVTFFVTDNTVPAYANLIAATSSSKVSVLKKGSDYNKDFVMTYDGVLVKYVGEGGDVVIPVGATEIPNSFFRYGSNGKSPNTTKNSVKSVTIPYTVKKVGQSIFEGITGLEKVTFTDAHAEDTNTYSVELASYSMQLCPSLTDVIFPSHAVSLKGGTFSGDGNLKTVTFNGEEATFTAAAFDYGSSGITCFVKNKNCNTYTNLSATNYFSSGKGVILKIGQVYDPNFTIDENGVLTNYLGTGGDVVVPVGVTRIESQAFKADGIHAPKCNNSSITSITFPYTVTTVGQSIIENATACKKIEFQNVPEDVTMPEGHSLTIASYSFHLSSGVEEFVLPKHTATVGAGLVTGSSSMKSITVYGENANFSSGAFSSNNEGMSVFVPNGTCTTYNTVKTAVGSKKIGILKIGQTYDPDFMMDIEGNINGYVGTATEAVIPFGATAIKSNAFSNTPVETLTVPYTVSLIETSAFEGCNSITDIIFEDAPVGEEENYSLTINAFAFQNTGVITRENGAIVSCEGGLTHIDLPSHKLILKNTAFSMIHNLKYISIRSKNVEYAPTPSSEFEGKCTYAFRGISNSVPVFFNRDAQDSQPFIDFTKTVTLSNGSKVPFVNSNNSGKNPYAMFMDDNDAAAAYDMIDPDFAVDYTGYLSKYNGTNRENVTVPRNVTVIGSGAFKMDTSIKTLTIPYTVKTIETSAFESAKIENILFEDAPEGQDDNYPLELKAWSLQQCQVSELTIPSRISVVANNAFGSLSKLYKIRFKSEDFTFGVNTFQYNISYVAVQVPNANCETYNSLKATTGYGTNVYAIIYPNEVSRDFIVDEEGKLLKYKGTDASPEIPSSVKTITSGAFKGKTSIVSIVIPYTVEKIDTSAFEGCTNLTKVTFTNAPAGEEDNYSLYINAHAFNLAGTTDKGIESLVFPTHTVSIGDFSFNGLKHLKYIAFCGEKVIYRPTPSSEYEGKCTYAFRGLSNSVPVFFNRDAQDSQAFTDFIKTVTLTSGSTVPFINSSPKPYALFMDNYDAESAYNAIDPDFTVDMSGLLSSYNGTSTVVTLPSTVTVISSSAFAGTNVEKIIVPYTVKEIKTSAFGKAYKLKEIIFEDAPLGQELNYELKLNAFSFNEAPGLTHVDLPTHTVYICDGAFGSITNLEYLSFRGRNIKYNMTSEFNNQLSYAFRYMNKQVPVFFNRNAQDSQAFLDFTKKVTIVGSNGKESTYNLFHTNGTPQPYYSFMDNGDAAAAFAAMDPNFMVDGSGTLKKYLGSAAEVTVPSYVKIIGNEAFSYNKNLIKLNIPKTVEVIESSIVFGCTNIKEINFEQVPVTQVSNYCLEIRAFAFQSTGTKVKDEEGKAIWSGGIEEISLPNYKVKLGGYAFGGMGSLKGIIINGREIEYALDGTDLTKARVTSFRSIGSSVGAVPVFFHKANVDSQAFTDFVKKLENGNRYLWDYGTGFFFRYLEDDGTPDYSKINPDFSVDGDGYMSKYNGAGGDVVIPYGVVTVDEHAFDSVRSANNVLSVNFPLTVKKIGTVLFKGMSNIKSITFNEGLEDIGQYAFEGTSVTELVFPSTLKSLKSGAFGGLKLIENITIYSKNVEIAEGVNPFANMGAVPTVWVVAGSETYNKIRNFEGADGSKFIVKTIGSKVYPGYKIINGQLDEYTGTESEIIIPEEVKRISANVFQNNENIKSVVLHSDVITIGESAFEGCKNLKEITLNEGLLKIGNNAFKGTAVEKVYLPSTLKSVSRGAFGDTPIKEVYVYGYNTKLPTSLGYKGAFENVTELTIYASHGSAAYDYATKFAEKHGFKFQLLNIAALGANGTEKPDKKKILFRTQTVSGNTISIDGVEYDITERGGIVIPADLLEDGAELTIDTATAAKAEYTVIVAKEKEVYEYELTFEDIPATSSTRNMAFRPYIKYKDKDGNDAYLYGNTIYRNAAAMKNYKDGNN